MMTPPRFRIQQQDMAIIKNEIESQMRQKVKDLEQMWDNNERMSTVGSMNPNGYQMQYGPGSALPFTSSYPYQGMANPTSQMGQGQNLIMQDSQNKDDMQFKQKLKMLQARNKEAEADIQVVDQQIQNLRNNGFQSQEVIQENKDLAFEREMKQPLRQDEQEQKEMRFKNNKKLVDPKQIFNEIYSSQEIKDVDKKLGEDGDLKPLEKNSMKYEKDNYKELGEFMDNLKQDSQNYGEEQYVKMAQEKFNQGLNEFNKVEQDENESKLMRQFEFKQDKSQQVQDQIQDKKDKLVKQSEQIEQNLKNQISNLQAEDDSQNGAIDDNDDYKSSNQQIMDEQNSKIDAKTQTIKHVEKNIKVQEKPQIELKQQSNGNKDNDSQNKKLSNEKKENKVMEDGPLDDDYDEDDNIIKSFRRKRRFRRKLRKFRR